MKEEILKIIDEQLESLRSYKSKLLDVLMINENDEFTKEQYAITIHQEYILIETRKKIEKVGE